MIPQARERFKLLNRQAADAVKAVEHVREQILELNGESGGLREELERLCDTFELQVSRNPEVPDVQPSCGVTPKGLI